MTPFKYSAIALLLTAARAASADECGVPDPSHPPAVSISGGKIAGIKQGIAGGQEAEPHSYPWVVRLGGCGASLLNKQWVLTAAHCVASTNGQAHASAYVKLGAHDSTKARGIQSSKIIVHPKYKGACNGRGYDIALIKLPEPVNFSDKIKPICLPSASDNFLTQGDKLVAAGWGAMDTPYTSVLQHVVIHTAQDDCKNTWIRQGVMNPKTEFCAWGGQWKMQGTCSGDSGGPQFIYRNGKYVQIGVTSCGQQGVCGSKTHPGFYTHVPSYVDWINGHIGDVDAGGVDVDPTCFDAAGWCAGYESSCESDGNVKQNCKKTCGKC